MKSIASILLLLPIIFSGSDANFSAKTIENNMVKVSDNLYANKFETTNAEYKAFLDWAKSSDDKAILKSSQIDSDNCPDISDDKFWKSYVNDERYGVIDDSHDGL